MPWPIAVSVSSTECRHRRGHTRYVFQPSLQLQLQPVYDVQVHHCSYGSNGNPKSQTIDYLQYLFRATHIRPWHPPSIR